MRSKLILLLALLCAPMLHAQLAVTYGSKGIATLSYNGTQLMNTSTFGYDTFSIRHVQSTTTTSSTPNSSGDLGYGENCATQSWNASTLTETYTCSWGSIATQFSISGNNLTAAITIANNSGSGEIIDGADVIPFTLHFPSMPKNFSGYAQFVASTATPPVYVADYGTGVATIAGLTAINPSIYTGWNLNSNESGSSNTDANGGIVYTPIMTTSPPTGAPSFLRPQYARLQPGSSLAYKVVVKFTNEGTAASLTDVAAAYTAAYPANTTLKNFSHAPIGSAFLASNTGGGNGNNPVGPTGCGLNSPNKNNWKVGGAVNCSTDPTTPAFQDNILVQAQSNVTNCKAFGCQGVITWDIEGEEFPQDASYVCAPNQVNTLAPEMNLAVNDGNFPKYSGVTNPKTGKPWVLIDAYFDIQTSAGLAVGHCIRPDAYTVTTVANPNDTAQNAFPGDGYDDTATNTGMIAQLEAKASYANSRWGSTLFYADSNVYADGSVADESIWQKVTADYPNYLFAPEALAGQWHGRLYAYAAQLYNFEDNGDLGTPFDYTYSPYAIYPNAYGVNLLNESGNVTSQVANLTTAASHGDIMMIHADYNDGNEGNVNTIVKNAAYTVPSSGGSSGTSTSSGPPYTDSFTGTSGTTLASPPWTIASYSGSSPVTYNGNAAYSANGMALYTGGTFNTLQYASVVYTGTINGGPVVLGSTNGNAYSWNAEYGLYALSGGSGASPGVKLSGNCPAVNTGDTMQLAVASLSPVTLVCMNVTTSAALTVTDSANTYTSGYPGFQTTGGVGAFTAGNSSTLPPTATAPAFSLAAGNYSSAQPLTISSTVSGASIYYTLDGSTPTTASALYSGVLTVASSETVTAVVYASGYIHSAVATAAYKIITPGNAQTWYVRPKGGTRYQVAANGQAGNPNGQCDGLGDADYPGTGVNQHCAFGDVRWLWSDGEYAQQGVYPTWGWVVQGGDTVVIHGSIADGVAYRIGWNNQTNAYDSTAQLFYGFNGDPFDSYMPSMPSGVKGQPTRFLGGNYQNCSAQTARTQLHGGYNADVVLQMSGTQYADVECLDVTDWSNCAQTGTATFPCNKNQGTFSDASGTGLTFTNKSGNLTFNNIRIHGMAGVGVAGPTGDTVTMNNFDIVGNPGAGWNADPGDGSTGMGVLNVSNFSIVYNGCAEEYPIVDALPYFQCTDDSSQGYGDGFGTATTGQLLNGSVGGSYSVQLPAYAGTAPYTYQLTSGYSLPPGLTLSSSGLLSGTFTTTVPTIYVFGTHGYDASGAYYASTFQLAVGPYPQGWQVHFDKGVVNNNTQDGLDALHLVGAGDSMTITGVLAYGNMGQQIKNGGESGVTSNNVIITNCNANRFAVPGTPAPTAVFTADLTARPSFTGTTVAGQSTITGVSNASSYSVGDYVYNAYPFPDGFEITQISGTTITGLTSDGVGAHSAGTYTFGAGSSALTNVNVTSGALAVGQYFSALNQGSAVTVPAQIVAINGSTVTMNQGAGVTIKQAQLNVAYNSNLSDFCRAADAGILMTTAYGSTGVFTSNTIMSAANSPVELGCETSKGACDSTSKFDFRNNLFVGFINGPSTGYVGNQVASNYPSEIYDGTGIPNGVFSSPGSYYSNNLSYHSAACPAYDETNATCTDPLLADETWHNYGSQDVTPQTGSPAFGAGATLPTITTDYNGTTRTAPYTIGAIQGAVAAVVNTIRHAFSNLHPGGLRGCRGCTNF